MKLGELFVDLGVNSGGAFNALSNFAFKFENLASLSERVTGWVEDFFGDTPEYAQKLNQLSKATGLSVKNLQDLKFSAERSGTTLESAVGKMSSLLTELTQWNLEGKKLDSGFFKKFQQIGFTPDELASITKVDQLIQSIIQKINQRPEIAQFAKSTILPQELFDTFDLYYNRREELDSLDESLTQDQINRLEKLDAKLKAVSENSSRRWNAWKADHSEMFNNLLKMMEDLNKEFFDAVTNADSFGEAIGNACDFASKKISNLWKELSLMVDETGTLTTAGNYLAEMFKTALAIVIDTIRGVGTILGALWDLTSGDWRSALKKLGGFIDNSAVAGVYKDITNPDNKNKEKYNWREDFEFIKMHQDELDYPMNDSLKTSFLQSPVNFSPVYNTSIYTDRDNVGNAYNSTLVASRDNSNIIDSMLERRGVNVG